MLYLAPHRDWSAHQVDYLNLLQRDRQTGITNFAEILVTGTRRTQAFSEVKDTLSRIELSKQTIINTLFNLNHYVSEEDVGDIYLPLRQLVRRLLPHLEFLHVDMSNRNDIKCLFKQTLNYEEEIKIDIDKLSSGERSIISFFMPFIEEQIGYHVAQLEAGGTTNLHRREMSLIILIDEPELHLHPLLQEAVLQYVRELAQAGGVQFIIATHSPTLLNLASEEELYVLTPRTDDPDYNQLVKIADTGDRLTEMRRLCGDMYVLTACRNIICIESEAPSSRVKASTDMRILELICPGIAKYVLLPSGGKGRAIEVAQRLHSLLYKDLPLISVMALVDADQSNSEDNPPWVVSLPVAMIENLLLVPKAIWAFLEPYKDTLVGLSGLRDIEEALNNIAKARRNNEISLRIQRLLRRYNYTVRLRGCTVEEIQASRNTNEAERITDLLSDEVRLKELIDKAAAEVDQILASGKALQLFHGKDILGDFLGRHIHKSNIGRDVFCIEVAKIIRSDPQLQQPAMELLASLDARLASLSEADQAQLANL